MKHYKIAFCGLGSIGKRHLKNVIKYLENRKNTYQIDLIRSGYGNTIEGNYLKYISNQYIYKDDIPKDYDIIFITNPTALHRDTINQYKNHTKSMFVEKPVVDTDLSNFNDLPKELVCYVACPLRYTKVLQYIKKNIDLTRVYCIRAICSTFLPNWHLQEDYRKSYSAHKDMGGGVAIDLIHEWDYLIWLFGKPNRVNSVCSKVSELEIDSEDIAVYIGQADNKIYELHLDYFGKKEIREVEFFLPDNQIKADIKKGIISFCNKQEELCLTEDRDSYQMKEIAHFFDIIEGKCENDNTVQNALETMRIALNKEG